MSRLTTELSPCKSHWTLRQRLNHYIDKSAGPKGCWPWRASVSKKKGGYGRFGVDGRRYLAHRVAWSLDRRRPVPKGKRVLHRCDNPICCNPRHLWLGTQKQNMADHMKKGRHKVFLGEDHHNAKVTEAEARCILRASGRHPAIASRYGISPSAVSNIKRGVSWAHLQEPKNGPEPPPREGDR